MKMVLKHVGAAICGAVIPPIVYFVITSFYGPRVPAAIVLSAGEVAPSPADSPTPTVTDTPTLVPTANPTVTPSPPPVTSGELDSWFTKYSNEYSIDRNKLWSIAVCESKLNVNAKNGDYGGLYQFLSGTWRSTRTAMNIDTNPDLRFNPEEAIKTAAFKISVSGYASWPNCSK